MVTGFALPAVLGPGSAELHPCHHGFPPTPPPAVPNAACPLRGPSAGADTGKTCHSQKVIYGPYVANPFSRLLMFRTCLCFRLSVDELKQISRWTSHQLRCVELPQTAAQSFPPQVVQTLSETQGLAETPFLPLNPCNAASSAVLLWLWPHMGSWGYRLSPFIHSHFLLDYLTVTSFLPFSPWKILAVFSVDWLTLLESDFLNLHLKAFVLLLPTFFFHSEQWPCISCRFTHANGSCQILSISGNQAAFIAERW